MERIAIDQIGYDPQYYPRVNGNEDWMTVHRYKESLKCNPWKSDAKKDGAFPAVVVVKTTGYEWPYLLLDGLHRLRAFAGAGYDRIWSDVERLPQSKWLERSVELNISSKRPLDSGDKRWVAKRLSESGWQPEKIAGLLEMEKSSFEKLMSTGVQKLSKAASKAIPIGRSNRQINGEHVGFLKEPFTDVTGTGNAVKTLQLQASVSSRNANQIIESFVALLESGCIDHTDEWVSERLEVIRRLLEEMVVTP